MYDLKTGQREKRGGQDLARPKNVAPPCFKCPKGPEPYTAELSVQNQQTLDYYHLCEADNAGLLPRDMIVLRNHSIIRRIRDDADKRDSAPIIVVPTLTTTSRPRAR